MICLNSFRVDPSNWIAYADADVNRPSAVHFHSTELQLLLKLKIYVKKLQSRNYVLPKNYWQSVDVGELPRLENDRSPLRPLELKFCTWKLQKKKENTFKEKEKEN